MHDNKEYRAYCHTYAEDIPLFHQPWWLDAVAGNDEWQGLVSSTLFRGKPSILPIYLTQKWGFTKIHKPLLTTYQGPWWAGIDELSLNEQMKLVHKTWPEIIHQLPRTSSFRHTIAPSFQYAYPFVEVGHQLSLRYTYTLDVSASAAQLFANFRRDVQRNIKKYSSLYHLVESEQLADLYPLVRAVYQRQAQNVPFSFATLNKIFLAAQQQEQVKLFLLQNSEGTLVAGLLLFFDYRKVYLLVSGVSPAGRKAGAMQVLIWETLQRLQKPPRTFDFCGSMLPKIAAANRAFGAVPSSYLEISKSSRFLKLIDSI